MNPLYTNSQQVNYPNFQVPSYVGQQAVTQVFFEPMSCILPPNEELGGLYLGNIEAAVDINLLKACQVRSVLTVAKDTELRYNDEFILFHQIIDADDVESFDLQKSFLECFEFLEKTRKYSNCLVHCFAGVSRSATIIIAYLMKYYDMSLQEALHHSKTQRGQVYPNSGFLKQLKKYETELKQQKIQNQFQQQLNQKGVQQQQQYAGSLHYQFVQQQPNQSIQHQVVGHLPQNVGQNQILSQDLLIKQQQQQQLQQQQQQQIQQQQQQHYVYGNTQPQVLGNTILQYGSNLPNQLSNQSTQSPHIPYDFQNNQQVKNPQVTADFQKNPQQQLLLLQQQQQPLQYQQLLYEQPKYQNKSNDLNENEFHYKNQQMDKKTDQSNMQVDFINENYVENLRPSFKQQQQNQQINQVQNVQFHQQVPLQYNQYSNQNPANFVTPQKYLHPQLANGQFFDQNQNIPHQEIYSQQIKPQQYAYPK